MARTASKAKAPFKKGDLVKQSFGDVLTVGMVNNVGTPEAPEWRVFCKSPGGGGGWVAAEGLKRVSSETAKTPKARAPRTATRAPRTATRAPRAATRAPAPAPRSARSAPKSVKELDREIERFVTADPLTLVMDALGKVPASGRFGTNKVFISELWKQVGGRLNMTLPMFKQWLLNQASAGSLTLARSDLRAAMDPEMVRASRVDDMGAEFQFVVDPHAAGW